MNTTILYFFFDLTKTHPWLTNVAIFFSEYMIYVLPIVVIGYVFFTEKKPISKVIYIVVVVSAAVFAAEILKHFFAIPRPFVTLDFVPLVPETNFSFPSMHATFAGALAGAAYFSISRHRAFTIFVILLCIAIGLSRVMLGVHYPADIIAGLVVGLIVAALGERFFA